MKIFPTRFIRFSAVLFGRFERPVHVASLIFLAAIASITHVGAEEAPRRLASFVNVKDFGAKGDGKTDDTDAIQAAVNNVAGLTKVFGRPWNASSPELIFPEGEYLISKTIVIASGMKPGAGLVKGKIAQTQFGNGMGFAFLRGIGKASIKQATPRADILYVGVAYRIVIENLGFDGGLHSINIWTANRDSCLPVIRKCRFLNSASYAIQAPYIKKNPAGDFLGYCEVNPDGTLTVTDDPSASHFLYHSTYLHIQDCEFVNCANVLFTVTDVAMMEDCRIETSPEMKGAAIRVGGLLKLENIEGLAHVKEGNEQRWIDLDFGTSVWLIGQNLNLTTDSEKGLCVIHCLDRFWIPDLYNPNSIVLQNCQFKVSGCPENAVILCQEVPNIISISNCVQTGSASVPALGFNTPKDAAYFTAKLKSGGTPAYLPSSAPSGGSPIVPGALAFMIDDRNLNMGCKLPASMEPYKRTPVPKEIDSKIGKIASINKDQVIQAKQFTDSVSRHIDAAAFGLTGDGVTDDTPAIRRAVQEAAGEKGLIEIDFPAAVCKIDGIIDLPSRVVLRGSGRTVFMAADGSESGFRTEDARDLAFLNCSFESGSKPASITIKRGASARILFDNCGFANASAAAVECLSDESERDLRCKNVLRVTNCVFFNNKQVVISNVTAIIDSCWLQTYQYSFKECVDLKSKRTWEKASFLSQLAKDNPVKDMPVIRNDGTMLIDGICGVPGSGWLHRDFRWVDNSGSLVCDYFRFGGESGGFPAMRNIPAPAKPSRFAAILKRLPASWIPAFLSPKEEPSFAAIQNSWISHFCGKGTNPEEQEFPQTFLVECHSIPEQLILRNNVGRDRSVPKFVNIDDTVQAESKEALDQLKNRLFMSCNTFPETSGIKK
jgi:hypothetical protein